MNPGPVEEASKVAVSTVEALKATPVVLAMVVLNVVLFGLIFYETHAAAERWKELVESAMKWCPSPGPQLPR